MWTKSTPHSSLCRTGGNIIPYTGSMVPGTWYLVQGTRKIQGAPQLLKACAHYHIYWYYYILTFGMLFSEMKTTPCNAIRRLLLRYLE